jgi:hypothetical protein
MSSKPLWQSLRSSPGDEELRRVLADALLGPDGAMKADEHPGEPHRRWIFFYGGSILVAD